MVRIDNTPNKRAAIHYCDLPYPTREEKFAILNQGFREETFTLLPDTPKNLFTPIDVEYLERYESFIPLNELFHRVPTSGIMVGRDHLLMDVDPENVKTNLQYLFTRQFSRLDELKINSASTRTWDRDEAIRSTSFEYAARHIIKLQYRAFDYRYLAYDTNLVEGHRQGYIDQISMTNPAITVTKASRRHHFAQRLSVVIPLKNVICLS